MKNLPKFLEEYFWDVDFAQVDLDKNRIYILKRLLEYGNMKAIRWLRKIFKTSEIRETICSARGFSRKTANFWAVLLDIPRENILCLKKRSSKAPKIFWPY